MFTSALSGSCSKSRVDYIPGAVRIKDGLYLGDQIAAKDMEFIASNKITHIINTIVKRVPNLFEKYGIQYLSVNWTEKETNIFDKKNNAMTLIFNFIEEAMEQGESVLIHSSFGKSRSGCVVIAYLMKKFSWSLQKSLDYLVSKKQSFRIRSNFLSQLQELEKRLMQTNKLSSSWNVYSHEEDLILANTHKNTSIVQVTEKPEPKINKKRVTWTERLTNGNITMQYSTVTSSSKYKDYMENYDFKPEYKLKSILKSDPDKDEDKNKNKEKDKDKEDRRGASSISRQNHSKEMEKKKKQTEEERMSKSQAIGSNRINNSYVVVNNFMSNEKSRAERYSSIPAREAKEKERKLQSKSGVRLFQYENFISAMRSPYDMNFMSRVGENSKPRRREENIDVHKGANQERPHSVNQDENYQSKGYTRQTATRYDIMYGNYNKNWPSQRENKYK